MSTPAVKRPGTEAASRLAGDEPGGSAGRDASERSVTRHPKLLPHARALLNHRTLPSDGLNRASRSGTGHRYVTV